MLRRRSYACMGIDILISHRTMAMLTPDDLARHARLGIDAEMLDRINRIDWRARDLIRKNDQQPQRPASG